MRSNACGFFLEATTVQEPNTLMNTPFCQIIRLNHLQTFA